MEDVLANTTGMTEIVRRDLGNFHGVPRRDSGWQSGG
jgi:hypothetical protein